MTNIVAFQEKESFESAPPRKVSLPRGNRRSLPDDESSQDPKMEPLPFSTTNIRHEIDEEDISKSNKTIFAWCFLRLLGFRDQTSPMLSGWLMQMRNRIAEIEVRKTFETFLPPMSTTVTPHETIYRLLLFLQHLSVEVNMPYVNVTMDVGAAMTA